MQEQKYIIQGIGISTTGAIVVDSRESAVKKARILRKVLGEMSRIYITEENAGFARIFRFDDGELVLVGS